MDEREEGLGDEKDGRGEREERCERIDGVASKKRRIIMGNGRMRGG